MEKLMLRELLEATGGTLLSGYEKDENVDRQETEILSVVTALTVTPMSAPLLKRELPAVLFPGLRRKYARTGFIFLWKIPEGHWGIWLIITEKNTM